MWPRRLRRGNISVDVQSTCSRMGTKSFNVAAPVKARKWMEIVAPSSADSGFNVAAPVKARKSSSAPDFPLAINRFNVAAPVKARKY